MAKEHDQEFVEYIIRGIVNHPDDVRTERTVDERGVLITLHINQEDMGYVIGRQGQTARAVRTLLKIVGAKNDARVNLKIYEPEGARRFRDARPDNGGHRDHSDRSIHNDHSSHSAASRVSEDIDTSAVDDLSI